MSDLIRRENIDKAIQSICDICGEMEKSNGIMCGACNLESFIRVLDGIPSAEPEQTAKVRDIVHTHGYPDEGLCGNCNADVNGLYNYCPYCGARLEWK